MKINMKMKTSAKVERDNLYENNKFEPLTVESGAFADTKHYSGMSTSAIYAIQLYGTKDGRIPSRNVLEFLQVFVDKNINVLSQIYIDNIHSGSETVGHMAGGYINSEHIRLIYDFVSPGNATSTIKQKGFNNPLINTGEMADQIFYSINGNGRYK